MDISISIYAYPVYRVPSPQKKPQTYPYLRQILTDFQFFTIYRHILCKIRNKVDCELRNILRHLNCVATLPCEI